MVSCLLPSLMADSHHFPAIFSPAFAFDRMAFSSAGLAGRFPCWEPSGGLDTMVKARGVDPGPATGPCARVLGDKFFIRLAGHAPLIRCHPALGVDAAQIYALPKYADPRLRTWVKPLLEISRRGSDSGLRLFRSAHCRSGHP